MNIGEKMRELLAQLNGQFNGVPLPNLRAECQDEWSADYAIVEGARPEVGRYFDHGEFRFDFREFVRQHFRPYDEKVMVCQHGVITFTLFYHSPEDEITLVFHATDEIEVYREKEIKDD